MCSIVLLEVYTLLSDFHRHSQLRIALSLRGDFELQLLSNVRIVKTLGTLGLNTFCVMQ
jgi:hypothetical protein